MNPDLTVDVGTVWFDLETKSLNTYDGISWRKASANFEIYEDKVNRLAEKYPAVAAAKAYLDEMVALVEYE
jgi:hypothetical protein